MVPTGRGARVRRALLSNGEPEDISCGAAGNEALLRMAVGAAIGPLAQGGRTSSSTIRRPARAATAMPVHRELRPSPTSGGSAAVRDLSPRRRPHAAGTPTLHIYGGAEDMFLNGSDRALRRVLAIGVLAFGAAVAQAAPVKPERFALLDQQQVALACVAAMNARGDQAMRNEDSTNGERLEQPCSSTCSRAVSGCSMPKSKTRCLTTGRARSDRRSEVERSAQSSYCFAAAAARVDAMPEHGVSRLRVEGYDTAQTIWTRYQATARAGGERVGALTL